MIRIMQIMTVITFFYLGLVLGMLTGHIVVVKDDGTVCAEVK